MKSNLIVLCADDLFRNKVSKLLANSLDMNFVDVQGIIEYELEDIENMIEMAGEEYFNKMRNKIIKRLLTYENSVIAVDINSLSENINIDKVKSSANILYLNLEKDDLVILQKSNKKLSRQQKQINEVVFYQRQQYYEKFAEIVIKINNLKIKEVVKDIIVELKKYFING